jgi:hypothetical protein
MKFKANKLKNPDIRKVDLVDAGANQGASVMLFKSLDGIDKKNPYHDARGRFTTGGGGGAGGGAGSAGSGGGGAGSSSGSKSEGGASGGDGSPLKRGGAVDYDVLDTTEAWESRKDKRTKSDDPKAKTVVGRETGKLILNYDMADLNLRDIMNFGDLDVALGDVEDITILAEEREVGIRRGKAYTGSNGKQFVPLKLKKSLAEGGETEMNLFEKIGKAIAQAIGDITGTEIDGDGDIAKAALSFGQEKKKEKYRRLIDQNWWDYQSALRKSVESILTDDDTDVDDKRDMVDKTLLEYNQAVLSLIFDKDFQEMVEKSGKKIASQRLERMKGMWKDLGKVIGEVEGLSLAEIVANMRDEDEDDDDVQKGLGDDDDDDLDDNNQNNEEEEVDTMKINKSKMTEEERNDSEKLENIGAMIPRTLKQKLQIYLIIQRKEYKQWLIEQIEKLEMPPVKTE